MGRVSEDANDYILKIDPGHQVWMNGIQQACGVFSPVIAHGMPVIIDHVKIWTWVWIADRSNYGVRIEQSGRNLFLCRVRGPRGHITLEHWGWFPNPDDIITMAMLAGFDWSIPDE